MVREPWASYLVDGKKVWELRGAACSLRGLATAGTIIGEVKVVDCIKVALRSTTGRLVGCRTARQCCRRCPKTARHRLDDFGSFPWKTWYVWVVANPLRYENPHSSVCIRSASSEFYF